MGAENPSLVRKNEQTQGTIEGDGLLSDRVLVGTFPPDLRRN